MPRLLAFLLAALLCGCAPAGGERPLVLAAASLQEVLNAAADAWAAQGHARPTLSFAASSALARQIESGAPADLFISADAEWMEHLAARDLIVARTRADLAGNRLVLVAPGVGHAGVPFTVAGFQEALGSGRIALADPDSVPAGRYARAALQNLDLWPTVADRIARAENVRAALALVERGEAPLGIVYATDARASDRVRVVAAIPPSSHPPIRYPAAMLTAARHSEAAAFLAFLQSDEARAIFVAYGFAPAPTLSTP